MGLMDKVTYTPAEFAEVFGKERTWAYRQLYAGKVKAITKLGRTMIPKSEVDRLLKEAGRYLGASAKVGKPSELASEPTKTAASKGAADWLKVVTQRKKHGLPPPANVHCEDGRKPSSPELLRPDGQSTSRQSVYQRLTRCKSSRKNGEGHDG